MPPCKIDVNFSSFKNECKAAGKRHHTFAGELLLILEAIEKDPYSVGDQINRSGDLFHFRKVRIGVPNEGVPARKGYRLIFQVTESPKGVIVCCLALYYKPERATMDPAEIKKLAKKAQ